MDITVDIMKISLFLALNAISLLGPNIDGLVSYLKRKHYLLHILFDDFNPDQATGHLSNENSIADVG